MADAAIVAKGLTKVYGKLTAVDHVDMRVATGGVFGLLGPNGAGKTTIIKVLTGLSDITEGEAQVAGFDVRRDPMHVKERIGWVAAEVILDDDLSAWENLWLQAKLQRLSDWKGRAEQLLAYFELSDRKKDKVGQYSTGMRKKLEIALAILHQPEVVFMDEPTIGLDPNTRRMLWQLITGVNREFGVTVLLTSHYMEEADALCDHVAIIDHGKFVAQGTPSELKARVKWDIVELETKETVTEERLRAIPGVSEVRTQGKSWILKVPSAEVALPQIIAALGSEEVKRINLEKPSLESVFMEITGKRIDQAGTDVQDYRKFYMNVRRARQ
ncbi:MAG: ATP-binding cassette domain-containing protein [Thermoplasmata archaeon]|nr:ATP-binding cassette domain-containing protein [Thermoplasmata archaeon]